MVHIRLDYSFQSDSSQDSIHEAEIFVGFPSDYSPIESGAKA